MRIDAHQHFWRYAPRDYPWITPDMAVLKEDFLPGDLAAHLDAHGFDGSIAVQARHSDSETGWLLDAATRHDRIKGVVGWIDLHADDLDARLARWDGRARLCGFRHQVQDEPDPGAFLNDPATRAGIRTLQRRGYVYDVLVHAPDLGPAAALCAACDDHVLVLDHLGKPAIREGGFQVWRDAISVFRGLDHVAAKLSGLVTEADWRHWTQADLAPYVDTALEVFGPERLMFGSDWPVCRLAGGFDAVFDAVTRATAALSDDERRALFGATARRVYRLRP